MNKNKRLTLFFGANSCPLTLSALLKLGSSLPLSEPPELQKGFPSTPVDYKDKFFTYLQ